MKHLWVKIIIAISIALVASWAITRYILNPMLGCFAGIVSAPMGIIIGALAVCIAISIHEND